MVEGALSPLYPVVCGGWGGWGGGGGARKGGRGRGGRVGTEQSSVLFLGTMKEAY